MHGLEKEYAGKVAVKIEDATTPANKTLIQGLGFRSHGLVIYGKSGEIETKLDGHSLQEPQIRGALLSVLADSSGS